jgi:deferrochelatase/peroxidase EfeB
MDTQPVGFEPPSWRLVATADGRDHPRETQGLVVSPFAHLSCAVALLLDCTSARPGWLGALRRVAPVTDASGKDDHRSVAIAFTATGLARLGLDRPDPEDADRAVLDSFQPAFREGMHQRDRQRRLGDFVEGTSRTVIAGGARWSANTPAMRSDGVTTPHTVHVLLLLYATGGDALDRWLSEVRGVLAAEGIALAQDPPPLLSFRFDAENRAREHFGFADGISQPVPFDAEGGVVTRRDRGPNPDVWHPMPLGDLLLGHVNAYGEIPPGPIVRDTGAVSPLPPDSAPEGYRDLGRNGSYLVVRELRQDVAAFWNTMDRGAAAIGQTPEWLAERIVGRTVDGDLLTREGCLPPRPFGGSTIPDNDFGFLASDPHGLGCPVGSHVRRGNPRDGLARNVAGGPALLRAANNHRFLRRGRKFGPDIADPRQDDGAYRGLMFICLCTDIPRQFEFVQQTWMLNRGFATLPDETDPLLGPPGLFTVPADPLRWRIPVETFIELAGGEYFFLPSIPALDWLTSLPPPP